MDLTRKIKKEVQLFLTGREAKVLKKDIAKIGLGAGVILSVLQQNGVAGADTGGGGDGHADHTSHQSSLESAGQNVTAEDGGHHLNHADSLAGGPGREPVPKHVDHEDAVYHEDGHYNHSNAITHDDAVAHADAPEEYHDQPSTHHDHPAAAPREHVSSSGGRHHSGAAPYDPVNRRGGHNSYMD